MSGNSRAFNYALRANKSVERKMLLDAFRMLHPYQPVKDYKYIGFGAVTFVDFRLVHKQLGISKMINIEQDSNRRRYEYNRPFQCIDMRWGASYQILSRFTNADWAERVIVWFDYTSGLDGNVLNDIRTVVQKAKPGSLLVVSFNAGRGEEGGQRTSPDEEKAKLADIFGLDNLPQDVDQRIKSSRLRPALLHELVSNQVLRYVSDGKASGLISDPNFTCTQVLNLLYSDNAPMLTFAWLLHGNEPEKDPTLSGFRTLRFYRDGPTPFEIVVPVLTHKEILRLEQFMPRNEALTGTVPLDGLSPAVIDQYSELYDYFPVFVEAELR